MSLLGVDAGTTGCKAVAFSAGGETVASSYEEYGFLFPEPGQAVLDSPTVWERIKSAIRNTAAACGGDPVTALAVSSMGEAMVPVTRDRRILGPSLLNFDVRGEEYLGQLGERLPDERLFRINGNALGNHFGLTKLMWLRDHQPELYGEAELFLNWGAFVPFMLGVEAAVDYSLANRSLLFDLDARDWSGELLSWSGLDRHRLPPTVASGTVLGTLSARLADELALPKNAVIVAGAHDQCANAVGCGAVPEGSAMLGMGTHFTIVPVYAHRPEARVMIAQGLNTEHHALPDRYVSFIYNLSGAIVKWYRDTFAAEEHRRAIERGEDVYTRLFEEIPSGPSSVTALPHFGPTLFPEPITHPNGVMTGLTLETRRGDILKGILEGAMYSLKETVDRLPEAGMKIREFRAVGGGSKSDAWVQLCADILDRPFVRPRVTEAGCLGAAILAGTGTGVFSSLEEGVGRMVALEKSFTPAPASVRAYAESYGRFRRLWPQIRGYLSGE
jgi:xylulokinase